MANLQSTLDALQPYVIGIRYIDGGVTVVDAVFKDGWILPESDIVKKAKGNDELNYFMLFSEKENVGLDELLGYVSMTIQANIEREKKHELLKEMVNELKIVFKKNSLANLKRLKFTFGEEELISDMDLDIPIDEPPFDIKEVPIEKLEYANEIGLGPIKPEEQEIRHEEVPLTEEDQEILEEERRAANFFTRQKEQKQTATIKKISSTIELPPKSNTKESILTAECECGPEEACNKCIENKGF